MIILSTSRSPTRWPNFDKKVKDMTFIDLELTLALSALVILLPISMLPQRAARITYRAVFIIMPIILATLSILDLTSVTDGKWLVPAIGVFLYLVVPLAVIREQRIKRIVSDASTE